MTALENPNATMIKVPEEITAPWLGAVLGLTDVELEESTRIGTGQMSQNFRVTFTAAGQPHSVVVKLASDDDTSRATGFGMGAYYREVAFYQNMAPKLGRALPQCFFAEYDPAEGWFTLVLEDVVDAQQGDQIGGCSVAEARLALRELARVHAPGFGDLATGTADWLNLPNPLNQALLAAVLPGFEEWYADRMDPAHLDVCRRFVAVADAWSADRRPPLGLVHGDYRLDNLLFGDSTCKVVDWQTVTWGPAMTDAAYFIGGGLTVEDRRAHEEELVRLYFDELLAHGVQNFSWETCWEEYRRATFLGVVMTVAASMVVVRSDRGDDMFMAWIARNAQQILDLDALSLLPEPGARPAALTPAADDDAGRHEPGPEPTWNESWYFDAVSDDGTLGLYTRLGRVPNQDMCIYTAAIVGPDRPAIMLVNYAAPLPAIDDQTQRIDVAGLRADQLCEEPLQRFHIRLEGTAQSHADDSAPLRDETGEPVEIAMDLVWETTGAPYLWRQSTRYEIPCRVTGSVIVGDEEIEFSGPGQRDHSWGARDWWANDWMWSAFHLSDGTHTHQVTIPQLPGFAVGYTQRDGEVAEIETGLCAETVADNGLITTATLTAGPDALELTVTPQAFGALRLVSPDGRVTHFPRAMATVETSDGRTGTGWIEWNRNQA